MTTLRAPDAVGHTPGSERGEVGPGRLGTRWRDRLEGPTLRDPRLHLAAVIVSLQVLGQAVLGFELSIAQILISVGTCAVLEVAITLWRRGVLAWPASALLTGNGVAFILRVPGTRHGDWWSTRGAGIFAATAAVSLLSKYLVRVRGRHVFNPSNIGLVLCFLVLGSGRVFPQDLWWGPMSPKLVLTLAVILVGGLTIATRLRMLALAAAFWVTFAACIAVVAAAGHSMSTRWQLTPVEGSAFWWTLVTSPEILVFLFFMITDPKTVPATRRGRVAFGAAVGFLGAALAAPTRTEFGTKVAVLAALAIVCALRPALASLPGTFPSLRDVVRGSYQVVAAVGVVAIAGAVLVVAGSPARPATRSAERFAGVAAPVARPPVALDASLVPTTTIDVAARKLRSPVTPAEATRVARDVVADLVIEADALRRQDRALAATAVSGTRLRSLLAQIDETRGGGRVVLATYELRRADVVVVQTAAWARPEVGLRVHGAVVRASYSGSPALLVGNPTRSSFARTFVLSLVGGHYLIEADHPS
jgi:Na+-translocating ferredoxin:NAD+ oxidoreductase RnfD subunit